MVLKGQYWFQRRFSILAENLQQPAMTQLIPPEHVDIPVTVPEQCSRFERWADVWEERISGTQR